jgi:hypothetical protein
MRSTRQRPKPISKSLSSEVLDRARAAEAAATLSHTGVQRSLLQEGVVETDRQTEDNYHRRNQAEDNYLNETADDLNTDTPNYLNETADDLNTDTPNYLNKTADDGPGQHVPTGDYGNIAYNANDAFAAAQTVFPRSQGSSFDGNTSQGAQPPLSFSQRFETARATQYKSSDPTNRNLVRADSSMHSSLNQKFDQKFQRSAGGSIASTSAASTSAAPSNIPSIAPTPQTTLPQTSLAAGKSAAKAMGTAAASTIAAAMASAAGGDQGRTLTSGEGDARGGLLMCSEVGY